MKVIPINPNIMGELFRSGKLTDGKYATIFQNKNWKIEVSYTGSSGWIIGDTVGDNFIRYNDGKIAYDNPYKIPKYIKRIVERFMSDYWEDLESWQ